MYKFKHITKLKYRLLYLKLNQIQNVYETIKMNIAHENKFNIK